MALKVCMRPGCPELIESGAYCDKHKKETTRYDKERGSSTARGYDYKWQIHRTIFLNMPDNTLCYDCLHMTPERVTASTEVHHIIAKQKGGMDEYSNLMGLCHDCHSKRTANGE
jgi:5-methylcytosine-specific restriction protein A